MSQPFASYKNHWSAVNVVNTTCIQGRNENTSCAELVNCWKGLPEPLYTQLNILALSPS